MGHNKGTRAALLAAGFVLIGTSASLAATEPTTNDAPGVQLASLGSSDAPGKRSSTSGGAVQWGASPSCLDSRLRQVINQVASVFGPVRVNSTCRSHSHNAKVGGATRSKHLTGDAADFSVSPKSKPAVLGWLRRQPSVGGLKLYADRGHFHIDTGPRRTW
jgi:Peptidase M15